MTKKTIEERLIASAKEALAIKRGELVPPQAYDLPLTTRHASAAPAPVYTKNQIAKIRSSLGLSQALFAEALNVSLGTVRSWEQGSGIPMVPRRDCYRLSNGCRRRCRPSFARSRHGPRASERAARSSIEVVISNTGVRTHSRTPETCPEGPAPSTSSRVSVISSRVATANSPGIARRPELAAARGRNRRQLARRSVQFLESGWSYDAYLVDQSLVFRLPRHAGACGRYRPRADPRSLDRRFRSRSGRCARRHRGLPICVRAAATGSQRSTRNGSSGAGEWPGSDAVHAVPPKCV